ncbi:hypothetical protein SK128_000655 [Halocaridina rubra]|uniref:Uncharacterized protein n=1 Tax=Halocaridina rubra TaxID=373956 RepID=A0AAN8XC41_HALRR
MFLSLWEEYLLRSTFLLPCQESHNYYPVFRHLHTQMIKFRGKEDLIILEMYNSGPEIHKLLHDFKTEVYFICKLSYDRKQTVIIVLHMKSTLYTSLHDW